MYEIKESFVEQITLIEASCANIKKKTAMLQEPDFDRIKTELISNVSKTEAIISNYGKTLSKTIDCIIYQCTDAPNIVLNYYDMISKLCGKLELMSKLLDDPNVHQLEGNIKGLSFIVESLKEDSINFKANIIMMGLSLINDIPLKIKGLESAIPAMEERLKVVDASIYKAGLAESFKARELELKSPKKCG